MGVIPAFPDLHAEQLECPPGEVETVRMTNPNSICIDQQTAQKWTELGIAEIIGKLESEEKLEPSEKTELDLGHEIFHTRIGDLELKSDYPTPETAQKLRDESFFQRAITVYQLAYPAVAGAGIFYDQDKVGGTYGDILYFSNFMSSDIELLTGNISVLYFLSLQDLSDGPIIIDVPTANFNAMVDNVYQQVLTDIGVAGPYKGNGGLILILPPGYDGEIPENYHVVQSDTMQVLFIGRSFVNDGDFSTAESAIKKIKTYKLSESQNPPNQKFIDVSGKSLKLSHPDTDGFWEFLHKVYSKETVVREEDKNLIGLMHSIGIFPGKPFEPDENSKKLLDEAAIVAELIMRNMAYDSPIKEHFIYYPGKNWELGFMTDNPQFEDKNGITQIIPRISFVYQAITTSDAMVLELVGKGSKYLMNYRDSEENYLEGSNTYHLNIPANVPAENFWSVVVYDAETRSQIKNNSQKWPGIKSLDSDKLIQNEDGSYDVYFGPESPEDYENNWVQTNEGDGFFVIFRFYSPTEAYYDKSWQLPMIEKIR